MAFKKKGFSLAEILVALLIMTVAIFGGMSLLPSSYLQITNAGRIEAMNHLAQKKMDYLRTLPYSSDQLAAGLHPVVADGEEFPEFPFKNQLFDDKLKYALTWNVADNSPANNMKTITVNVFYDMWASNGTPIAAATVDYQKTNTYVTYITQ